MYFKYWFHKPSIDQRMMLSDLFFSFYFSGQWENSCSFWCKEVCGEQKGLCLKSFVQIVNFNIVSHVKICDPLFIIIYQIMEMTGLILLRFNYEVLFDCHALSIKLINDPSCWWHSVL